MIRIIKAGTRQRIQCHECGCLFSYEEEDIQTKGTHLGLQSQSIDLIDKRYVECPQCKTEVNVGATPRA